jgi:TonB family protein
MRCINKHINALFIVIPISLAIFSTNVFANTKNFFALYSEYSSNIESQQSSDLLAKQAENLAELAKTIYGETHDNTINLTISAANHYRDAGNDTASLTLYDKSLGLYKKSDKDTSVDMGNLLIEILSTSSGLLGRDDRERLSTDLYRVLKDYFDEDSADTNHLLRSLFFFNQLVENAEYTRTMGGLRSLTKRLLKASSMHLPAATQVLVRANFNYGRLAEGTNRKDEAIEYYTKVIGVTEKGLDFTHPFALGAHARLVGLYESAGDSQEATRHCIAIGKMTPWQDDINPTPLHRVDPSYPVNYARISKEGFAIIEFDISPQGFINNANIVETNGDLFGKESLKAIEKWRYAPKFSDGIAVTAKGLRVKLDFVLSQNNDKKLSNS